MIKKILSKSLRTLTPSKKYLIVIGCIVIVLGLVKLINTSFSKSHLPAHVKDYFNSNYKIFSLRIPKNLNFSGEKVPISKFDIHQAMEYELFKNTYQQLQTVVLHRRVNRWFPIIEPILKKNGIPDDFKYLALVESNLTNAISQKGAIGFWQILETTGTEFGLEITDEIDERYHVIKSTEVACKYFLEAYKKFNNWTLVAASYNRGINGIARELKSQKVTSFYDLHIAEETTNYIYRILAIKEIISRPKIYGYHLQKKDRYTSVIPTKFIRVDTSIYDLDKFANLLGINYTILQLFNPWIRANTLNVLVKIKNQGLEAPNFKLKKYTLEIPISKTEILNIDTTGGCEVVLVEVDSTKNKMPKKRHQDTLELENCQIENIIENQKRK